MSTFVIEQGLDFKLSVFLQEIADLAKLQGYCWASNRFLASKFDRKNRTIQLWLKKLIEAGRVKLQMIYKENSKEIAERRIFVINEIPKNYTGGRVKNCADSNNIINNIYKSSISLTTEEKASDPQIDDEFIKPSKEPESLRELSPSDQELRDIAIQLKTAGVTFQRRNRERDRGILRWIQEKNLLEQLKEAVANAKKWNPQSLNLEYIRKTLISQIEKAAKQPPARQSEVTAYCPWNAYPGESEQAYKARLRSKGDELDRKKAREIEDLQKPATFCESAMNAIKDMLRIGGVNAKKNALREDSEKTPQRARLDLCSSIREAEKRRS